MLRIPLENTVKTLSFLYHLLLVKFYAAPTAKWEYLTDLTLNIAAQTMKDFKLKAVNGQLDCYSVLPPSIIAWRMEFPKHGFWRPQNKLTPVPVQLARPKSPLPCSPLSESPSTFSVTVSIFLFYSFFFFFEHLLTIFQQRFLFVKGDWN